MAGNSVELFNLQNYSLKILASDTLKFSKLTWQKEGDGLAFLKSYKKDKYDEENAVVYSYTDIYKTPVLKTFDPETAKGFPAGMSISNKAVVSMSDDMTSVFIALDPLSRWPGFSRVLGGSALFAAIFHRFMLGRGGGDDRGMA